MNWIAPIGLTVLMYLIGAVMIINLPHTMFN